MTDFVLKLLCRNFNAALKDLPWCYVGYVAEYGGVAELRRSFENSLHEHPELVFSEDDCSKFDLGKRKRSFRITLRIRLHNQHPDLRVHNNVLCHLYKDARVKNLIWLDGRVIRCKRGNPSGFANTSEDNSLDHFLDKYYTIVIDRGYSPSYFKDVCKLVIVSDDGLSLIPKDCTDPKILASTAARFGRVWKGHPRQPDRSIINREFCSIRFLPVGHVIARDKAFASANFRGKLSDELFLAKLQSLATLLAGCPADLDLFVKWVAEAGWYVDVERARSIALGALCELPCF